MLYLHTAGWQPGKPCGRFDSDVPGVLSEVCFDAIDQIGLVHDSIHDFMLKLQLFVEFGYHAAKGGM